MSDADSIFDELQTSYTRWNLKYLPFSESASSLGLRLQTVFTGRQTELRTVFGQLMGDAGRSILVYGWIGIGKTAFILEVLRVLKERDPKTLTAYIRLDPKVDLATAALIALAKAMPDDDWAQRQLNQMGLCTDKPLRNVSKTAGVGMVATAELTEENVDIEPLQYATLSFEDLLQRARKKYQRVIIGIDDLDKHDPAKAKNLLLDAQGMLKGDASFLLTGHPFGLTRDYLMAERGMFDLTLKLEQLDIDTLYLILSKYLHSVRVRPLRQPDDLENPAIWQPFTPETARQLCEKAEGVPRWLNRAGNYVLQKALTLNADQITPEVLQAGFLYMNEQLRGTQGLTAQDYYVLEVLLEKQVLSNDTLTLEDLERMKVKEFSEILPILEGLQQRDLARRSNVDWAIEYRPTPLIQPHDSQA